ncbi:2-keto-3-deoxygluconate permease [Stieleria varia]|uniref:2-keto-3-deoxygluconate permease n=1 Tax=Stieleria varia TaxID=2528005 RepID=A0A5C6B9I7_9BACT|nr:2-keto-3-deoxygluconate permease [Stieleria varia]TWU08101.1 2-keto-3-deoxygluconate permease [Stieleria varia]
MPKWFKRVPGGLMIIPILIGAALSTVDRVHFEPVQQILRWVGVPPVESVDGVEKYEFLQIGGFATALTSVGATTLIVMFLVCVSAQMDVGVGRNAIQKGAIRTSTELFVAIACGYAIAAAQIVLMAGSGFRWLPLWLRCQRVTADFTWH